jgi:hypothetical protein
MVLMLLLVREEALERKILSHLLIESIKPIIKALDIPIWQEEEEELFL